MDDQRSEFAPPFKVTVYKTNTAPLQFDGVTEVKMTALGVLVTYRWVNDDGDTRDLSVSVRRHVIEQVVIVNEAEQSGRKDQADDR